MFYTFTQGRSRTYWPDLENAVRCAVKHQLLQGKDIKYVTVYEVGTDRIRYQYCERCDKATQWDWDQQEYDRYASYANPVARYSKGRRPEAYCVECGERVAVRTFSVNAQADPLEQLAFMFEVHMNQGFQPTNVESDLSKRRNWERMSVSDAIRWYARELSYKGCTFNIEHGPSTAEQNKTLQTPIRHILNSSRKDEMQTRVMDMRALEGPR
jgi:hypothetical protein